VYNRIRGMTASSILFFYWLLMAVCGAVQFRTEIRNANDNYYFYSYVIYYPLVVVEFLLHCFADKPPIFSEFPPAKVKEKQYY